MVGQGSGVFIKGQNIGEEVISDGWGSKATRKVAPGAANTFWTRAGRRIFIQFWVLRDAARGPTPRIPLRGIFYPSIAVPTLSSEHTFVAGDVGVLRFFVTIGILLVVFMDAS